MTGLHTVCDIFCKGCQNLIGWKYVGFFHFFFKNFIGNKLKKWKFFKRTWFLAFLVKILDLFFNFFMLLMRKIFKKRIFFNIFRTRPLMKPRNIRKASIFWRRTIWRNFIGLISYKSPLILLLLFKILCATIFVNFEGTVNIIIENINKFERFYSK